MLPGILRQHSIERLFYMIHLDTVAKVLLNGILPFNEAFSTPHISIADEYIQARRSHKSFRLGRSNDHLFLNLHNYVPLYFTTHTPMQYRVTKGTREEGPRIGLEELVFIEVHPRKVFETPGVLFTDGNAAADNTRIFEDIADLDQIELGGILWDKWSRRFEAKEIKRRKAAEVLVPNHVPREHFSRVLTYNEFAKLKIMRDYKKTARALGQPQETICECSVASYPYAAILR